MENIYHIEELLKKALIERDRCKEAVVDLDDYALGKWIPRFEDRMKEIKNKKGITSGERVNLVEKFINGYWDGKEKNKELTEYYSKKLKESEENVAALQSQLAQLQKEESGQVRLDEPIPADAAAVFDSVFGKEEDRIRQLIIGGLPERQSFDLDDSVVEEVLHRNILLIINKLKIPYRKNGRIKTTDLWKGLIYNALMDINNLKPVSEADLLNCYKKKDKEG
jgi:hypothetical protein